MLGSKAEAISYIQPGQIWQDKSTVFRVKELSERLF
jgi:hypothetical protein